MEWWHFLVGVVTVLGYLLTLSLLPVVLLTKKDQTVSTVAWVMAIVTMPYLGALLFLVFGINRVGRRLRSRQVATVVIERGLPRLAPHHQIHSEPMLPVYRALMHLAHRVAGTQPTVGNQLL